MTLSRSSLPSREEQLTVREALACVKIGRSTLYRLIKSGRVTAVTDAGPIRLHADTVRSLAPKAVA